MNFASPLWLLALLIVPGLAYFFMVAARKKRKLSIRFSSINLVKAAGGKHSNKDRVIFGIALSAIILLVIGLADPHIPLEQSKEGVNVVLAIDISGSMQATDYKPTRVDAAKESAKALVNQLGPKDLVGVVTFSDGATTAAYLTPFKDKAIQKIDAIKSSQGSTAIGDGLSLAIDMATSIPNKKKVVILLSDGVSNAGVVSPDDAILFAQANQIQVYTIGLGSIQPVLLGYDYFGNPQYAQLDESTLQKIAAGTGGEYYKSVDEKTLEGIYAKLPEKIQRELEDTSIKDWFIASAIVLLTIMLYLKYWRFRSLP